MTIMVRKSQAGVVLITSLIMLVVLTLLAVSMLRTSIIELKIGGASQIAAQNQSNAEAAIWAFLNTVNTQGDDLVFVHSNNAGYLCDALGILSLNFCTNPLNSASKQVTLAATEIACTDFAGVGSGNMLGNNTLQAVYFDIQADAQDAVFSGRTIVHQGVRAMLPPGGCS